MWDRMTYLRFSKIIMAVFKLSNPFENKGCSTTRIGNWQFNGDFTGTVKRVSINQKG